MILAGLGCGNHNSCPNHGHRFVASDYHCFPNSTFSQNFKCTKAVTDLQTNGLSLTVVTTGQKKVNTSKNGSLTSCLVNTALRPEETVVTESHATTCIFDQTS